MKLIFISFVYLLSTVAYAANECRGVETAQLEFSKMLSRDEKSLKKLPAPNEESEKCNIILSKETSASSDSYQVISRMPEKYASYIKREVEVAKRRGLSFTSAVHYEASMVKCYCSQRSMRLGNGHRISDYGIISSDSCKNIEDAQKIFRNGFARDAEKLKTEKSKVIFEANKIEEEDEKSMCKWLSKQETFSENKVSQALSSIRHSYSEYIRKEMASVIEKGASPFSATSLGAAMSLCYCLERSLQK